jgi:hypothetical protein
MELSLHEIFTEVSEESSINKKSAILLEHDSQGLQIFLRCVFDDKVTWLVPDSKPPYEPNDAPEWDLADSRLEQEALKIGRFIQVDGQTPLQGRDITRTRREQLFIQVLEGLHPTEADLLMSGVKKKLKYKGLTKRVVDKAFPSLII